MLHRAREHRFQRWPRPGKESYEESERTVLKGPGSARGSGPLRWGERVAMGAMLFWPLLASCPGPESKFYLTPQTFVLYIQSRAMKVINQISKFLRFPGMTGRGGARL